MKNCMFLWNNINDKMAPFPKMRNYQPLKKVHESIIFAQVIRRASPAVTHPAQELVSTVGKNSSPQSSRYVSRRNHEGHEVVHVRLGVSHPKIPIPLWMKWHVMGDFAEIFMHEILLYVSLSLLESHLSFWLKGCQRGHHIPFKTSCLHCFLPEQFWEIKTPATLEAPKQLCCQTKGF